MSILEGWTCGVSRIELLIHKLSIPLTYVPVYPDRTSFTSCPTPRREFKCNLQRLEALFNLSGSILLRLRSCYRQKSRTPKSVVTQSRFCLTIPIETKTKGINFFTLYYLGILIHKEHNLILGLQGSLWVGDCRGRVGFDRCTFRLSKESNSGLSWRERGRMGVVLNCCRCASLAQ